MSKIHTHRHNSSQSGKGIMEIPSYKNPKRLMKFLSEGGRILPRRITGVSAKMQRMLKRSIQVARVLALLPFSNK
jgi:ribosomal protein S18